MIDTTKAEMFFYLKTNSYIGFICNETKLYSYKLNRLLNSLYHLKSNKNSEFFCVVAQAICDFETSIILVYMIVNGKGVSVVVVLMGAVLFPFFS